MASQEPFNFGSLARVTAARNTRVWRGAQREKDVDLDNKNRTTNNSVARGWRVPQWSRMRTTFPKAEVVYLV